MADVLVTDHAEVGELLGEALAAFDGGEAARALARLDYVWARLAVHIRAEHLQLFPALLAAADARGETESGAPSAAEVRATVEHLREDHDFFMRELAAAVNSLKELNAGGGADEVGRLAHIRGRVLAVAARLEEHNRVEEERAYRWPEALCGEAEREALASELRREVENLPPRFAGGPPR